MAEIPDISPKYPVISFRDKVKLPISFRDDVELGADKPSEGATRSKTFVQDEAPTGDYKPGDWWLDSDDAKHPYRANESLTWVDVIGTADDTKNVNAIASTQVQPRAEVLWKNGLFIGSVDDGLTETVAGSGILTRRLLLTRIRVQAANDDSILTSVGVSAGVAGTIDYSFGAFDYDFQANTVFNATPTGADIFFGVQENFATTAVPANSTSTATHIGFFIDAGTIYASVANGTTQTKSSAITGVTLTNENIWRINITGSSSAKFYVNEVLKATITTNLPASNGPAIYIGATGQDGQDLIMELFNNYFISTII